MSRELIPADFPTLPGLDALAAVVVNDQPGPDTESVGHVVFTEGDVAAELGLDRDALTRAGFDANLGATLVIPTPAGPDLIAVGGGVAADLDVDGLRAVGAALARATSRRDHVALVFGAGPAGAAAVQALTEGAVLARYHYSPLRAEPKHHALRTLSLVLPDTSAEDVAAGSAAAVPALRATIVARDLANTPPDHLTATDMAAIAVDLGARFGFEVENFDKAALIELNCGGLLGVNRGSVEEPRMIKLRYRPEGDPAGHLGLIGKGIMFDSGGISLKPSDPMHLLMKMDMGGAAAVLGAFTGLRELGVEAEVTGWLSCTDNMPSSTAYKLGDILVTHGGTSIEVKNTDAEGRLVMSDAFDLANEDGVDAIIDIATLTGAALMALGQLTAPLYANDDRMADLVLAGSVTADEQLWRMPLEHKYRKQLNSAIADISNLGGPFAGATTAALFLNHFAAGTPWAHIDIAGTMQSDTDDSWRSAGATGFGARTLLNAAAAYTR